MYVTRYVYILGQYCKGVMPARGWPGVIIYIELRPEDKRANLVIVDWTR